ncbi:hypothetical protein GIB67_024100 [Kingdonia uniflora]|uniref:Uncharacterized protein n=1 Tax=Kingdonia uniflora TaxID=39325 RepID=A0A7J7MMW7_9MAGN|nr:hypothetical protein GIB67_024100 [Kingdonia uniflora]
MVGTYVEEDVVDEDVRVEEGVVTGLDAVSPITDLENRGEDNEKELKDMRLRIEELENELAKEKGASTSLLTLLAELVDLELRSKLTRKDNKLGKARADLAQSENLATTNSRVKKVEARERSRNKKGDAGISIVKGDVANLLARIEELEADVAQIQAHVQKGNERLRVSQNKLDVALGR